MKIIIGVLFAAGIIIAGSDGPYFPWINLVGVMGVAAAAPLSWVSIARDHDK